MVDQNQEGVVVVRGGAEGFAQEISCRSSTTSRIQGRQFKGAN